MKDYDDWLARLDTFPAYVDQNIALHARRACATTSLLPKVIVRRCSDQIATLATQPPQTERLLQALHCISRDVIAEADRTRLPADRARSAFARACSPPSRRSATFLEREYLPACYDQVGWSQTSSGEAGYAYLRAPLHDHGPDAAADPRARAERGGAHPRRDGARSRRRRTSPGTLQEFFTFLRTDPRFFYKTPADLLEGYRALAKRIDPELIKVIGTLPRLPYGVTPIPDAVAPNTTAAYANQGAPDGSRPAYFFVNLYKPEMRPKWEMLALTLHEASSRPLPAGVASRLNLASCRRSAAMPASPPMSKAGRSTRNRWARTWASTTTTRTHGSDRLTYEMWRAVRLVVDTGMHVMHWDRERAIRYFMDNAAKTELDVTNEIDRYISWPGQALAYKVGELKIKELREQARKQLGDAIRSPRLQRSRTGDGPGAAAGARSAGRDVDCGGRPGAGEGNAGALIPETERSSAPAAMGARKVSSAYFRCLLTNLVIANMLTDALAAEDRLQGRVRVDLPLVLRVLQLVLLDVSPQALRHLGARNRLRSDDRRELLAGRDRLHERRVRFPGTLLRSSSWQSSSSQS